MTSHKRKLDLYALDPLQEKQFSGIKFHSD